VNNVVGELIMGKIAVQKAVNSRSLLKVAWPQ
jgi:hypothetical protein